MNKAAEHSKSNFIVLLITITMTFKKELFHFDKLYYTYATVAIAIYGQHSILFLNSIFINFTIEIVIPDCGLTRMNLTFHTKRKQKAAYLCSWQMTSYTDNQRQWFTIKLKDPASWDSIQSDVKLFHS